jgi:internalin A
MIGPALTGLANLALTETGKGQLEMACRLLEDLPDIATDLPNLPHNATADFAQLREALIAIAPNWAGLRERQLPESGGIVYLCPQHRQALRYPQLTPEQTGPT